MITGTGQANVEGWLTIQGAVVSVDANTLVVQTSSGEQETVLDDGRSFFNTSSIG